MDILYGNGHHLTHAALALVTDNAHRAHEVLPELSLDVAENGSNHIVLERHFAVLFNEIPFGNLRKCVGVGYKVAPLVAIAVHKASPQLAASLIESIPAGSTFIKELIGRTRFPLRFLYLAGGCFNTFVKKFIHHTIFFQFKPSGSSSRKGKRSRHLRSSISLLRLRLFSSSLLRYSS